MSLNNLDVGNFENLEASVYSLPANNFREAVMTEQEWLVSEDSAAMLRCGDRNLSQFAFSDRKLRLFACACCRLAWNGLTDDVPCGLCGGKGVIARGMATPSHKPCRNCSGTGRVNRSRRAVEVAERFADRLATKEELLKAHSAAQCSRSDPGGCVYCAAWYASQGRLDPARVISAISQQYAAQAALLRDIFGNPFRPVTARRQRDFVFGESARKIPCVYKEHVTPTVISLAQAAYDERLPDGLLDPVRLMVLADALEEAGCDSPELLNHLRGKCPGCTDKTGFQWSKVADCRTCHGSGECGPHVRGCWVLDLILRKG